MRRIAWIAGSGIALAGCGYPDFTFRAAADVGAFDAADDVTVDTFVADSGAPLDTAMEAPSPSDSTVDSGATDTTTTIDAVADTTVFDTFVPTGCTGSTALFCEDWDKTTTTKASFDWTNVDPTGALALETTGRSAPNAFVATTSPGDASVVTANVGKYFTTSTADTAMRIDAWMKLESTTFPTSSGGAFLFKIERGGSGSTGDGVTFSIDDSGLYVDRIGVTYGLYPIAFKPKAGTWFHARLDVKLHTTSGSITLFLDDMTAPVLNVTGVSTVKVDSTERNLLVGLYSENGSGTFRVRYDDVSLALR